MTRIIDSMGREYAALHAARDIIVTDPVTGTTRKIMAGKPVPAGLEQAYQIAVGEEDEASEEPVEAPARKRRKAAD